jgi:NhaA family Na+:H+ antiporter
MAIFFLLIGLEIERELYIGELSDLKNALLPVIAASGGMVIPALLHFFFNRGTETQAGIAIPMATDIAFALGVLALLGSKVPASLKIFLTALAIVDDLGAIIIIALFYVGNFSLSYLLAALGVFGLLVAMNRLGIHRLPVYLLPGVVMWYFMYKSGIHATLAGILLAFAVPFGQGDAASPSYRLQHALHKPTSFLIMPLFALANTGIMLDGNWAAGLLTASSMGIIIGLVLGKPLGIALFSLIAVKSGLSQLPEGVTWQHIIGAGCLGGIGFTMSIFITLLAFNSPELVQNAKTSILLSSLTAGFLGYLLLARSAPHPNIVVSVHR